MFASCLLANTKIEGRPSGKKIKIIIPICSIVYYISNCILFNMNI